MRHIQPKALTLLVRGYPDVKNAKHAILLEADEIIVKPFEPKTLALVHDKPLTRKLAGPTPKERVAGILQRCTGHIVEDWLARVKKNMELSRVALIDQERTRYLPKLIDDLVLCLRSPHITVQEGDRARLDINREQVAEDRRSGMSLTQAARKSSISRASVCRLMKEANGSTHLAVLSPR
jgi:YesN/AraC family two-component response regulator